MGAVIEKAMGLAALFVGLAMASGHPEWVWKGVAYVRHQALTEVRKPWGCPSIFNDGACNGYDPKRYR